MTESDTLISSVALHWVRRVLGRFGLPCQYCLLVIMKGMVYTWSWRIPPQDSAIRAGNVVRICQLAHDGVRNPSQGFTVGLLVLRCFVNMVMVFRSKRESPCIQPLNEEKSGAHSWWMGILFAWDTYHHFNAMCIAAMFYAFFIFFSWFPKWGSNPGPGSESTEA